MGDQWTIGGATALALNAMDVATSYDVLDGAWPSGLDPDLLADHRVRSVIDQFCVDVTGIDAAQRRDFLEATGSAAFLVLQVAFVGDYWPRVRSGLDALFGPSDWFDTERFETTDLWMLVDDVMRKIARLDALDATTTELVRLRGARQHQCRICQSRRSVEALDEGATEETFDAIDFYLDSDLPDAAKAALSLTDSLIWTPDAIPEAVVADVHQHLTPPQAVEVVLDVTRNAANKIAVALAADNAHVTEGVELFRTDLDGVLSRVERDRR